MWQSYKKNDFQKLEKEGLKIRDYKNRKNEVASHIEITRHNDK